MKCEVALFKNLLILFLFVSLSRNVWSQRYLSGVDTSVFIKDSVRPLLKKFENIRISGYMQPQFQVAQSSGIQSYAGGNFSQFSRSRFMLRRARIRIDYLLATKDHMPRALFVFQIDGSERGVIIRDIYIRLYETWKNNVSLMSGFFARPFGYEVNLGSSSRETPERGRMSQILMPGERDLGMALVFEPQSPSHKLSHFRWDAGFFNGQGQSGTTDFDNYKDFITRFTIKPYKLGHSELSGGLSLLLGGWKNGTKYVYSMGAANGFIVDSATSNTGKSSPRHYYGGDLQFKLHHEWGETELRGEYWFGTQPGTAASSTNPGSIPNVNGIPVPTYVRHFDGAFFYLLQNIINSRHQVMIKYDWYDPNTKTARSQIGQPNSNLTLADIKYNTLGIGYAFNFNTQTKLILYYDIVRNEKTSLAAYTGDLKDNVFTSRLQFRF